MLKTKFHYLYRDASNYKCYNQVLLEGTLSFIEEQEFRSCLVDGVYFIPEQVGLPANRFDEINDDDHCWFEFVGLEEIQTDEIGIMTAAELLKRFKAAKGAWNEVEYAGAYGVAF